MQDIGDIDKNFEVNESLISAAAVDTNQSRGLIDRPTKLLDSVPLADFKPPPEVDETVAKNASFGGN